MSKIHKALERAQRERGADLTREVLPLVLEDLEKGKKESARRVMEPHPRGPLVAEKVISGQKLVTFYDPDSVASEQFRKLRTQLLRLRLPKPPRTILVTSAKAGEGKTFTSANLAAGIAHEFNAHALLVDADLRNPSLGDWFGISNGYGLSDYLVGRKEIPELLIKTEIERLRILLGGTLQDNATELIGSARMEALIQELKSRYADRYIIFDSTPLLATSEPEVLSKMVDGILIVVRAGETPRETVKQAISSLEKEKILGMVLNDLQFRSSGLTNRYFGSNDPYYGYRYGQKKKGSDNGQ
ncbi:MAG: polysaccharide biosynthesis tyrosine autokinase [Syntrophaceae bacterium]|nr:polysaccharide biosynthesis tyrosine autokinase [Syntrophaceae bacterium]